MEYSLDVTDEGHGHSTPVELFVRSGPCNKCLFGDSFEFSTCAKNHSNLAGFLRMINAVMGNVPYAAIIKGQFFRTERVLRSLSQ